MVWRSVLAVAALLAAGCAEPPAPDAPVATLEPVAVLEAPTLPPLPSPTPVQDEAEAATPWAPGLYSIELQVQGEEATGYVAVPAQTPTTLVVVAHGWGGWARYHQRDLQDLADEGAVAVAMDFRGGRGEFKVKTGVEDTVAVTRFLQDAYPSVDRTLLYGWSMGGEIALLAPLHAPAGTYDYVFAGAAVSDLTSFWGNPLAQAAVEAETGGRPTDVPAEYDWRSPWKTAPALAQAGLARVFLVHGSADVIVPIDESERLYQALVDAGQPVSYYVVTKDRLVGPCVKAVCTPTMGGPGDHGAGAYRLLEPFIQHRIERASDPVEPALRGTYDGETGVYEPSDTGP